MRLIKIYLISLLSLMVVIFGILTIKRGLALSLLKNDENVFFEGWRFLGIDLKGFEKFALPAIPGFSMDSVNLHGDLITEPGRLVEISQALTWYSFESRVAFRNFENPNEALNILSNAGIRELVIEDSLCNFSSLERKGWRRMRHLYCSNSKGKISRIDVFRNLESVVCEFCDYEDGFFESLLKLRSLREVDLEPRNEYILSKIFIDELKRHSPTVILGEGFVYGP